MDAAYGEQFTFSAFNTTGDVDLPKSPDATRPAFTVIGTWYGQAMSDEPKARGAKQDDNAHTWIASRPQVSVEDAALLWPVRPGDRVTRELDQQVYEISAVMPESARRTVFELTSRKRTTP
ncbi:MAG TPA: hypothetical protein VFS91_00910 [Nitrobacter sp.]|nr:hypothetical protein [Nitrobacter sp.]